MKYKMLITDYDGTLGNLNEIDTETLSAVKSYILSGGKFVICTGRSHDSILPVLKKYGLSCDIISFQGALITLKDGTIMHNGGVDKNLVTELYHKLKKEGICPGLYVNDHLRYTDTNKEMEFYLSVVGVGAKKVESIEEVAFNDGNIIRKLVALGPKEKILGGQKKYAKEYQGRLIVNASAPVILEAIAPENSKGEGVKKIASYYNIPLNEVLTVGDSLNDIELVRGAWHGVAVGDAMQELKDVAKEIAPPFSEHPIKYLIEKYK